MLTKIAKGKSMPSASVIASSLVQREETRSRSRMNAYYAVAGKLGMSASWVRRLVSGGIKKIDADLKQRLDDLLIRELEAEIARLTHDLEMARQGGAHPASRHVGEIESLLAQARALMEGKR